MKGPEIYSVLSDRRDREDSAACIDNKYWKLKWINGCWKKHRPQTSPPHSEDIKKCIKCILSTTKRSFEMFQHKPSMSDSIYSDLSKWSRFALMDIHTNTDNLMNLNI